MSVFSNHNLAKIIYDYLPIVCDRRALSEANKRLRAISKRWKIDTRCSCKEGLHPFKSGCDRRIVCCKCYDFTILCANGHLHLCKKYYKNSYHSDAIKVAAINDQLHIFKWLMDKIENNNQAILDIFNYVIEIGKIEPCKMIAKNYNAGSGYVAFKKAAINAHLDICKWLADYYKIEHIGYIEYIFITVAAYRHVYICKWLQKKYKIPIGTINLGYRTLGPF